MVNLRINDRPVTVEDGTSILHAARQLGITIPSLCYLKHVSKVAACRVCMVEIKGTDRLMAACDTICAEGMEVYTNTLRALVARRNNVQQLRYLRPQRQLHAAEARRGYEHHREPL